MKRKTPQHSRGLREGLALLLLGVSLLLVPASLEAQSSPSRVAVLTPGLAYTPVLEGLRQGLARLGYQEGKTITFLIREVLERVDRLVE